MRGRRWSAIVCLCAACGGRAASLETNAGASGAAQVETGGGGAANAPSSAAGAASAAGGVNASGTAGLGDSDAGGVGGEAIPNLPYVPDHAVSFDQAYFEDGSFEAANGFGWDTCFTRTPGHLGTSQGDAQEGLRSFEFSSEACDSCTYEGPSTSQVYLWFKQQPASAMSLYFDVLNLSNSPPLGELRLEMTNGACITERPLATLALADLALEPSWQTRCVDLPAFGAGSALGIAVAGTSFDIALDALRLGPPCHTR